MSNTLEKELKIDIEYSIDNNLFFEKVYIHSCSIHQLLYIKYYRMKNKISLNELVDNSINRYIDDLKELKRVYELDEDTNLLYSEKRYKNNISKELLKELKYKFMNSKLYYLDCVIVSVKNPYLEYFYLFLNSINNSLYIKENQFNNSSTQYNNDNYVNKIKSMRENAENFFDENLLIDSKLHKGIIETYKEDKIEGSMIISSITNKIFTKLIQIMDIEEINEKDKIILNRNQQFHKKFEYVNFTENEMYNGFAQACFYNYGQARIEQFKSLRKEYNKNKTATIPNFTKDIISKEIIELFNLVLDEQNAIKNIRQNKKSPNILKIYDDIVIYTTKNLSEIDKGFYKFIIESFFNETPKMQNFVKNNEDDMKNLTSQLRILFY